ncbi:M20/M25/M40 family metallo-hydrolase [Haladaptatus pallidirubidus]|uniref:M20/M25/M40 family metallo-hydrolase n=1 Tax=Haladaptatus pallidirubidus TaxID=1008152 RepID=UPI0031E5B885
MDKGLGVPDEHELATVRARARDEGVPEEMLGEMGDVTGLVAGRIYGDGTEPVVGVRVESGALEQMEARDESHIPMRDGFVSRHSEEMHACGHDEHTAVGIGRERELDESVFNGTLKLFFQPAEEGGRGTIPMSKSGVDDLDATLRLGLDNRTGSHCRIRSSPV